MRYPLLLVHIGAMALNSLFLATSLLAQSNPCDRVSGLLSAASELRGLSSTGALRCISLNNLQFNELARNLESKTNSARAIKAQAILYKVLGIVPQDYPYESCLSAEAGEANSAFYDRTNKQIVLRNDVHTPDFVLIHELTHALQDQRFDLNKLRHQATSSDSDQAISAIVEGDAVFQEESFQSNLKRPSEHHDSSPQKMTESRCKPPEPLYSIGMFPYEWGLRFAASLYQAGGADFIEKMFITPALTSRDILYPADYLKQDRRAVKAFKISTPRLPGYRLLLRDTLGEFTLRNLLKQFTDMGTGVLAAKGWEQDIIELYQKTGQPTVICWQIEMKTEHDAQELIAALRIYSLSRFGIQVRDKATSWAAKGADGYQINVSSSEHSVQLTIKSAL